MYGGRYCTIRSVIFWLTLAAQSVLGQGLPTIPMPLATGAASRAGDPLRGQIQLTAAREEFAQQELAASASTDIALPPGMEALPTPGRNGQSTLGTGSTGSGFDPAVVTRGSAAFDTACTQCHDADRALSKTKSLTGWLATVRRMAAMDGADISSDEIRPIATYLASRSAPSAGAAMASGTGAGKGDQTGGGGEVAGSGLGLSGTLSTLWRGGNDNRENPGFFADAWLRADWQPSGPMSGRVTSCTSCHSDSTGGGGFTLELVEATARLDLMHWHKKRAEETGCCAPPLEASVKAGRFVVPFGAFAAMSHPGVYRTVTNPLMYIMGRTVNVAPPRRPVLPMPYADEGIDLEGRLDICGDVAATLDVRRSTAD